MSRQNWELGKLQREAKKNYEQQQWKGNVALERMQSVFPVQKDVRSI